MKPNWGTFGQWTSLASYSFVKLYDLSYGFEIVLATSKLQKLQDTCIILYYVKKRVTINSK